jgi:hypothetical protein
VGCFEKYEANLREELIIDEKDMIFAIYHSYSNDYFR